MSDIAIGSLLRVRTADGKIVEKRAVSEVIAGQDFPVVWVCWPEVWDPTNVEACKATAVPWPASAVEDVAA